MYTVIIGLALLQLAVGFPTSDQCEGVRCDWKAYPNTGCPSTGCLHCDTRDGHVFTCMEPRPFSAANSVPASAQCEGARCDWKAYPNTGCPSTGCSHCDTRDGHVFTCMEPRPFTAANGDCSIGGCSWAGMMCLDVGSACDTTACKAAYTVAHLHCNKTSAENTSDEQFALDCHTDHQQQDDISISIQNPSNIKLKVKTCDATSVNGSTATCQGNPLKPNSYLQCGAKDDRIMPKTTRTIQMNSNVSYITFSNGVGVKTLYPPKDAFGKLTWPANYSVHISEEASEVSASSDCSVMGCAWAGGLCLDVGNACNTTVCSDAYKLAHLHCKEP